MAPLLIYRDSPLSSSVYSSSKKQALQSFSNGTSPHLAALQRCRLTPLPANTRSVVNPDPLLNVERVEEDAEAVPLRPKDPLLQEKILYDAQTISSLKQRLVVLEREVSVSYSAEKKITTLNHENQRFQVQKAQQQARIDELDKAVLRQRHEYDKLAVRFAAVYANLQKLVDQQHNSADTSAKQSALQALARENQDFLRKLRVLEARHTEDRALTSNQEKKIKRLKAEIEALHHMHETKAREEDYEEVSSGTDHVSPVSTQKKGDNNHGGRPNSASSPVSITSSTPRRMGSSVRMQADREVTALGATSHLVTAEAYQYIDPSILKVLEKVDSQFSITNAINLSVVLKKWLNSCVHVVFSTHLPTVLQTLLKRICELLHCEHAALFTVDHAVRKLVATCSERGVERWKLPLDKGISGNAARHSMLCNVHCSNDDPRFYSSIDSVIGTTSREVLALPLVHELQLYLEAHVGGKDSKTNNLGVFAVLRAWNTTHQNPFSANDQILGSLLAIQAGIILRQTAVTKTLQKINHKMHQVLQMPSEIVVKASTSHHAPSPESPESREPSIPSVVQLVAVAEKELAGCVGVKQLRIFILDAAARKLWHVGENPSTDDSPTVVRCYVSSQASLCSLLLRSDAESIVLPLPTADAAFNDTVDIPGGARGLYLVPILSPWGNGSLPFGMIQVSRVAKARLSASPFALTVSEETGNESAAGIVVNNEREAAQKTEDRLMLELLGHFCSVFASLLHHITAQQLYDTCPPEIMQAQLAT
ncbi:cAMP and cAMP-inhibited cGMP 3' [Phytophthora citrophthora]|uniref:cAMP and cAMP-inhibited cGMP 3 n=1 Tax=Phytophthora citrophthora TaxID=4793 RepID=A0AAD9LAJ6_9STRA|nr:cAMP and cAMP-inhibited cGMP 3' [Phytophthora citrophthora]